MQCLKNMKKENKMTAKKPVAKKPVAKKPEAPQKPKDNFGDMYKGIPSQQGVK